MKSKAVLNPILTGYAVEFMQDAKEFVGRDLFPVFPTAEQSAGYYVFDAENALNVPTNIRRTPGTPYRRIQSQLSDDAFACKDYGIAEPVDDTEYAKYASHLDADQAATGRAANVVMVNHEIRVHKKATGAGVPTSTPGTKWGAGGASPIADIASIKEVIHDACGLDPNTLVLPRAVYNVVKELDEILERIKYTQRGIVTAELLAAIFGVDRVLVPGLVTNTAAEGQPVVAGKIWGESVVLAHVNSARDLKAPNFGRTFSWTQQSGPNGIQIDSYRDEDALSNVHRAKQFADEKLVGAACGYHLSNVL